MITEYWLTITIILIAITTYAFIQSLNKLKEKKFRVIWTITPLLMIVLLLTFVVDIFVNVSLQRIQPENAVMLIYYTIGTIILLIILKKSITTLNQVRDRKEKLIKMNFVLDTEAEEKAHKYETKAGNLEDLNKQLGMQAEILSEKERELQEINTNLSQTQEELKEEKASVEKKVVQRTNELRIEKEKVEDLLTQKNDFINQLSHDLKTPLTPLLNLLPILRDKTEDKEDSHILEICVKNTQYLKKLVLSTLELSKLNAKNNNMLTITKDSPKRVLDEIIETNEKFNIESLKIENKIDPKIKLNIDSTKIREVFENLITNTIKYTEGEDKQLEVTSEKEGEYFKLMFKDNGMGIEPKDLNSIFDEFYKVDPSRHQHDSSGLGLSIAKKIVEMHKGTIIATSAGRNKGSIFTIKLPLGA